ncbi:hypothetical protein JHD50_02480 [Sulfurimonas sp. MAG313]|nr:hypothetical protein [Sulfurimonas sp. MAG313]MDF1880178.1 hypothetical protein [Sulfurimonas sp. MAG313]
MQSSSQAIPSYEGRGFIKALSLVLLMLTKLLAFESTPLPTGFDISASLTQHSSALLNPHLQEYPNYTAGQAVSIELNKDKSKAAILTSGYNLLYDKNGNVDKDNSTEYLFIYDIREDEAIQKQVIKVPNTFYGLRWHPKEDALFVSGGKDDFIYRYDAGENGYTLTQKIDLHHDKVLKKVDPMVAEFEFSLDGKFLVVANMENDSLTLIDVKSSSILDEIDLHLDSTDLEKSGGSYPFGVAITKENTVYVSSMRDNELIKLQIKGKKLKIIKRIKVGSQPTRLLYLKHTNELFICESRSDSIRVINTKNDTTKTRFNTLAPKRYYTNKKNLKGANPNAMTLSKDGDKLYVSNGGTNSIASFTLTRKEESLKVHFDTLIPTQWYPSALVVKEDILFVLNSKSLSGANLKGCRKNVGTNYKITKECKANNEYVWQSKNSSLERIILPKEKEYEASTLAVLKNNKMRSNALKKNQNELMDFLRTKIKHVIYVVKENRTFDQVLGDLEKANADSNLTLFPESIVPNHYALARNFVTIDNFMASGSCSGDGWAWITAARSTQYLEMMMPILYAHRGTSYDVEGHNRNIPVGLDSLALRNENNPQTKTLNMKLHGTADVAAPDGPDEEAATGYLWNAALRKNLHIRNYGFFCNNSRYFLNEKDKNYLLPHQNSYALSYKQSFPNKKELLEVTDPYFRGYDMRYPDLWRVNEWKREYKGFIATKNMPNLMMVRLPHDHFGGFSTALAKVNTPLKQMADNDYALGKLVETVAKGPYKDSTLIFVTEDDAQNGADHVSAQRTLAYIVGPYVKQGAIISKHYTTVHLIKTMESILGLDALNINDASVNPMYEVFDKSQINWSYKAKIADILYTTELDLPKRDKKLKVPKDRTSQYWEDAMKNQNFDSEDQLDEKAFNKALWEGIKGKNLAKGATKQDH